GITRACHGTSMAAGTRRTSGGVSFSLPGQKGQFATNDAAGFRSLWRAISSGRRARSVAITTHSLVAKFWRSSDISHSQQSVHQSSTVEQSPRVVFLRLNEREGGRAHRIRLWISDGIPPKEISLV